MNLTLCFSITCDCLHYTHGNISGGPALLKGRYAPVLKTKWIGLYSCLTDPGCSELARGSLAVKSVTPGGRALYMWSLLHSAAGVCSTHCVLALCGRCAHQQAIRKEETFASNSSMVPCMVPSEREKEEISFSPSRFLKF